MDPNPVAHCLSALAAFLLKSMAMMMDMMVLVMMILMTMMMVMIDQDMGV